MKTLFLTLLFISTVTSSVASARVATGPTDRPQGAYCGYYVIPNTGYTVPAYPAYPVHPIYPAQPIYPAYPVAPATTACACLAFNSYSGIWNVVTNVFPGANLYPADMIVQAQQLCYNWVVYNLNYGNPVVNGTSVNCGY